MAERAPSDRLLIATCGIWCTNGRSVILMPCPGSCEAFFHLRSLPGKEYRPAIPTAREFRLRLFLLDLASSDYNGQIMCITVDEVQQAEATTHACTSKR